MDDLTEEQRLQPRRNADGTITVPLRFPIKSEGDPLAEVTVRRPTGAILRKMDQFRGGEASSNLGLIQLTTALAPSSIDQLDGDDVEAIADVLRGFTKRRSAPISA